MSCGFVSRDSGAQDFGLSCLRLRGFRACHVPKTDSALLIWLRLPSGVVAEHASQAHLSLHHTGDRERLSRFTVQ